MCCCLQSNLRIFLEELLPEDVHERCSNRAYVRLTNVWLFLPMNVISTVADRHDPGCRFLSQGRFHAQEICCSLNTVHGWVHLCMEGAAGFMPTNLPDVNCVVNCRKI